MKLTLEINMDNAAFEDSPGQEAARILRLAARKVEGAEAQDIGSFPLLDSNGNKVGRVTVEGSQP
jgi:hypothetical protein